VDGVPGQSRDTLEHWAEHLCLNIGTEALQQPAASSLSMKLGRLSLRGESHGACSEGLTHRGSKPH
jgi:hypothetical protein